MAYNIQDMEQEQLYLDQVKNDEHLKVFLESVTTNLPPSAMVDVLCPLVQKHLLIKEIVFTSQTR
jgi:hypothetical protein